MPLFTSYIFACFRRPSERTCCHPFFPFLPLPCCRQTALCWRRGGNALRCLPPCLWKDPRNQEKYVMLSLLKRGKEEGKAVSICRKTCHAFSRRAWLCCLCSHRSGGTYRLLLLLLPPKKMASSLHSDNVGVATFVRPFPRK